MLSVSACILDSTLSSFRWHLCGCHPLSRNVAQFGGAPGLGPGGRRFKSCHSDYRLEESEILLVDTIQV